MEFVKFMDIDGDPVYLRKDMITSIYISSEKSCTAIDYSDGETFYIKGKIDDVAGIFLDYQGRGIYA